MILSLRRTALTTTLAAGAMLACTTPAFAAKSSVYFSVSVYPALYEWDGAGTPPANPSTGSYYASYDVRPIDGAKDVDYRVEQVRGGAVVPNVSPRSVQVGDVFRIVDRSSGATIASTAFAGAPTITSSVLGQASFAGTNTSGATSLSVSLQRRIARNVSGYGYNNTPITPRATNDFEVVSYGRLTAIGDTTFGGLFSTPIAAGDYISVSQSVDRVANDVDITENFSVVAPAGVVPPADVTPPKPRWSRCSASP